jgi:hypothetical protein
MLNIPLAAAAIASVVITGGTATALMLGGTHTAAPPSAGTPVVAQEVPDMVVQTFTWPKQADATGYRLYLDGVVISLTSFNSVVVPVVCGVRHRFNAQPFNNKGVSPLAPPAYWTPPCDRATPR